MHKRRDSQLIRMNPLVTIIVIPFDGLLIGECGARERIEMFQFSLLYIESCLVEQLLGIDFGLSVKFIVKTLFFSLISISFHFHLLNHEGSLHNVTTNSFSWENRFLDDIRSVECESFCFQWLFACLLNRWLVGGKKTFLVANFCIKKHFNCW